MKCAFCKNEQTGNCEDCALPVCDKCNNSRNSHPCDDSVIGAHGTLGGKI